MTDNEAYQCNDVPIRASGRPPVEAYLPNYFLPKYHQANIRQDSWPVIKAKAPENVKRADAPWDLKNIISESGALLHPRSVPSKQERMANVPCMPFYGVLPTIEKKHVFKKGSFRNDTLGCVSVPIQKTAHQLF